MLLQDVTCCSLYANYAMICVGHKRYTFPKVKGYSANHIAKQVNNTKSPEPFTPLLRKLYGSQRRDLVTYLLCVLAARKGVRINGINVSSLSSPSKMDNVLRNSYNVVL